MAADSRPGRTATLTPDRDTRPRVALSRSSRAARSAAWDRPVQIRLRLRPQRPGGRVGPNDNEPTLLRRWRFDRRPRGNLPPNQAPAPAAIKQPSAPSIGTGIFVASARSTPVGRARTDVLFRVPAARARVLFATARAAADGGLIGRLGHVQTSDPASLAMAKARADVAPVHGSGRPAKSTMTATPSRASGGRSGDIEADDRHRLDTVRRIRPQGACRRR